MIDKVGKMNKIKTMESCKSYLILPRSGSCFSFQEIYRTIALSYQGNFLIRHKELFIFVYLIYFISYNNFL
jgi:hypothetical protein